MELYELPDGWEWKKIGEVANTTSGGTPSRTRPEFYNGSIPWLKSGELEDNFISDTEEKISESGLKNSSAKIFPKGTALVALYGATVGKTGILQIASATNQAVCAIFPRDNSFTAEYMTHWLRSQRQSLIELSAGGAQPNISQGIIRDFDIPLPKLSEQQRIVAKIESLFEQSRTARTALERVPKLISHFRRAVLASAFRGELVESDPNDGPAAPLLERIREAREQSGYKKTIEPLDTSGLPELPEGWVWTTVEQIGDVSGGLTKNSKRGALPKKLPYLRVANVYFNELDLTDVQKIGIQESELARTLLKKGDLLVVEGNGSIEQIGRVAVWDGSIQPCVHQNHIIKVRFAPTDISRYVLFWLLSTEGRDQIMKVTSSTSGLYTLSLSKVSQLLVPLAPLALQSRIVAKIEALFAQADIIEQAAYASLRRAEQVDRSILARAFRGELG